MRLLRFNHSRQAVGNRRARGHDHAYRTPGNPRHAEGEKGGAAFVDTRMHPNIWPGYEG